MDITFILIYINNYHYEPEYREKGNYYQMLVICEQFIECLQYTFSGYKAENSWEWKSVLLEGTRVVTKISKSSSIRGIHLHPHDFISPFLGLPSANERCPSFHTLTTRLTH